MSTNEARATIKQDADDVRKRREYSKSLYGDELPSEQAIDKLLLYIEQLEKSLEEA